MSKISKAILLGLFASLMTAIIVFIDPFQNLPIRTFLNIFGIGALVFLFGWFLDNLGTKKGQ